MSANAELLNPKDHAGLRFRDWPEHGPHFVQIVAAEFAAAGATCPILLTKDGATGRFYAGAMFGFEPGEYLLAPGAAAFRPLDLERQGFFISGENIAIDPDHPRFSRTEGEPLFDAAGEPGDKLRLIQRVLGRLKTGVDETDAFIETLLKHRLIEPIDIELAFDDGKNLNLTGLYTVSLDALQELEDAVVLDLFRSGRLQLAYCMIQSLKQVPVLARRRNERLAA